MLNIFMKGGPVMYPLLACSIIVLTVIIERIIFWIGMDMLRDKSLVDWTERSPPLRLRAGAHAAICTRDGGADRDRRDPRKRDSVRRARPRSRAREIGAH